MRRGAVAWAGPARIRAELPAEVAEDAPGFLVSDATRAEFGAVGLLPSLLTGGGAALLSLVLIVALVRYRRPWAATPERISRG